MMYLGSWKILMVQTVLSRNVCTAFQLNFYLERSANGKLLF